MIRNMVIRGDNLEVMRGMPAASVDLIATDPPYNSGADYGEFDDRFASMTDYLDFMRPVLAECHRLLKPSGSIYLIVDASASHYLKVEMDRIFGIQNFRRDINWSATPPGGIRTRHANWMKSSYRILYYTKSAARTFNPQYKQYKQSSLDRFKSDFKDGRSYQRTGGGNPNGVRMTDSWTDIDARAWDRQWRYPTAKPVKLMERIIKASSNEGELVLDPFCGSGSACAAAHSLGRDYIGIDCNENAVRIAEERLAAGTPASPLLQAGGR